MASLLGLAGQGTLTTAEATVYDSSVDVMPQAANLHWLIYTIYNRDALIDALIRIPQIHGSGVWFRIPAGQAQDFPLSAYFGTIVVLGKSDSSSITISGGITGWG